MIGALTDGPFDVIIAGGGAAGCVLAGRLSEVCHRRVLLIEAGPDVPPGREHSDIIDPFPVADANPQFLWPDLTAEAQAVSAGSARQPTPFLQGLGVGGGSNINGMGADRGLPADFDEWRDLGVVGWGWNDVLPYYKKLERDTDFEGTLHGTEGPIPIRRIPPVDWGPFATAIGHALRRRGYPLINDYNADFGDGLSSFPMNSTAGRRMSASMAYLTANVRQRSNLTVLTHTMVERLTCTGRQVTGVIARHAGNPIEIKARDTILCCGALQSPAVLMRSGIGANTALRALGISPICNLPAVGHNLQNHPVLILTTHLPSNAIQPRSQRCLLQNILRYSSGYPRCPAQDMLLYPFNRSAWHPLGQRVGALIIYVNKVFSKGTVELLSSKTDVSPRVRFALLEDPRDYERMVAGLKFALELLHDPAVTSVRHEVFLPDERIVAALARKTPRNWLGSMLLTQLLASAPLRRRLLRKVTLDTKSLLRSREALCQFVKTHTHAAYHVCGTCKMGDPASADTVCDSNARIVKMGGLRVADASIFPTIPCANTHLTVLMTAEKIADHVKAEWRAADRVSP